MSKHLLTQSIESIDKGQSVSALEQGKILFFPAYFFSFMHPMLLSELILDGKHKNISFDPKSQKLGVFNNNISGLEPVLKTLMQGFADFSLELVEKVLPAYAAHLEWGRTSFRPAKVEGRALSKRKDDTRLHVDAFVASPVYGKRILRVFCNINPDNRSREWLVGEPFEQVLERFAPKIPAYQLWKAKLLHMIRATKRLRSAYDHSMLHIHDAMKMDDKYQAEVPKETIHFPSGSSWIVFTDSVSHAALSGQYLLEQTFYLPAQQMVNPNLSPRNQLARFSC